MRILISNFGPISEFEYDLSRDFIVTYGDNNIGKSYAMQIVYLLLKNMYDYASLYAPYYYRSYSSYYRFGGASSSRIKATVSSFANGSNSSINITELINNCVCKDLEEKITNSLLVSCDNTFGNFTAIRKKNPEIQVSIEEQIIVFNLGESPSVIGDFYSFSTFIKKASSSFHKSRKYNGHLDVYYYDRAETTIEVISEQIETCIKELSIKILAYVGNVYFLPASRSGIYSGMSAFSSIVAELSKNKAMLTRKIELPGISEPISDYFIMLSSLKPQKNDSYADIYERIEAEILKGDVRFNRNKNLVYISDGIEHEFEMTEVSSMVSEVAPIVAFLKYIINSRRTKYYSAKPILFIEEPEAHLHPKNQIKLVEIFSELHKYDIKIVISSHSNYVFNKLNNLVLSRKLGIDVYSAILLQSFGAGSKSEFMKMDELGVDDTNFLDVAQALYSEREAIIDVLNA